MKRYLAFLALLHTVAAPAFESRWTQGLQVSWEELPGGTSFGGMSLLIQRATGRDVPLLAQRILEEWRRESGFERVRMLSQGDWSIGARIHQGRSQVTQWRVSGESPELIWSDSDLYRQALSTPVPKYLVSYCRWTGPVRGTVAETTYSQSTGHCDARPSTVLAAVEGALIREGWRIRRDPAGLNANRVNRRLQAVVAPGGKRSGAVGTDAASTIVVLELQPFGSLAR